MKFLKSLAFFTGLALMLIFTACDEQMPTSGKLVVKITDDPIVIEKIEHLLVTIDKIDIRRADTVTDDPYMVIMEQPVTVDLVKLRNGVVDTLVNLEIPVGRYDLVRLYVHEADIKIQDMDAYEMKVPGGNQTGIKVFIKPDLVIVGGMSTDVLIDFDLSRSVVVRGSLTMRTNFQGFIFKPVVKAINQSIAGSIFGTVVDNSFIELENSYVWVQADTVLSTTITDEYGNYGFVGIPEGLYTVAATHEGYDTVSYGDVRVFAGNRTQKNFILTPLK